QSEALLGIAKRAVVETPCAHGFDCLLSQLTEAEVAEHVAQTINAFLVEGATETRDSVIAFASLQFPHLMSPHLPALAEIRPNKDCCYEYHPWRGADACEIARLTALLDPATDPAEVKRAEWRLMETRRPDAIENLIKWRKQAYPSDPLPDLHSVDFELIDGLPAPLTSPVLYHLHFPENFEREPRWEEEAYDPTWIAPEGGTIPVALGGEVAGSCSNCSRRLSRLIRFEAQPSGLGHAGWDGPLEIVVCRDCAGWEIDVLYYGHDASGAAHCLSGGSGTAKPKFAGDPPVRAGEGRLARSSARWFYQDWLWSNHRENLNRVGGPGVWVQGGAYPLCVRCRQTMRLLMQCDSNWSDAEGGEVMWMSGGIASIFWCGGCSVSALQSQWT
ncbi:MAG: hypothetical protein KTR21_02920, partial [Rhodobacteraceae bacterium]|nr:hypothetical protein [Paracoccaceae bacterium]